jgi:hypothetical protein
MTHVVYNGTGVCEVLHDVMNILSHLFHDNSTFTHPTVSRVGFLFEWYMTTCASFTQFRKCRTAAGVTRAGDTLIPQDEQDELISLNQYKFTGWLLFHVSSTGTNARR